MIERKSNSILQPTATEFSSWRRLPAVSLIWHEINQELRGLMQNTAFAYLRSFETPSLTAQLIGELENVQELFVDGSISLKVGERGQYLIPFQMETMPPVGKRLNEDAFFIEKTADENELIIGVIDGASSQKRIVGLEPASGAFHLSHLASLGFTQSEDWKTLMHSPNVDAISILKSLNDWLHGQLGSVDGINYDDVLSIPGAACTFVTVNPTTGICSFAHVADTLLAVEKSNGEISVLTDNKNEPFDHQTGELVAQIAKERDISFLEAAKDERVRNQLRESFTVKINTPSGTGILNGMPELFNNNLVQHGSFSMKGIKRIIVMSDGAYAPWQQVVSPTLQLPPEIFTAIDQARANGHSPLSTTGRLIQTDPDAVRYHRFKPQDDATFVAIDLV